MLQASLAYSKGVGIRTRWLVIGGDPHFFEITKRLHNNLYGSPGDGGPLDEAERAHYESTLRRNADDLLAIVQAGDVVIVHDPQPAGLLRALVDAGALVVWRCHVGVDHPNEWSERGWEFLQRYLEPAHAFVFTRHAFAPEWIAKRGVHAIVPFIDPFSNKNRELSPDEIDGVLCHAGLLADHGTAAEVRFRRRDGSIGVVTSYADVLQTGPPPPVDAPLVVQVSRWDRMKDMAGVMRGFAEHVDGTSDAHLLLAGPVVSGVADDPEGGATLDECVVQWRALPHETRARVHLACIPMHDSEENATIVNALQRHAAVVVQKSIAEGFGLTVLEAMWKARPVVASDVGGIADQIVDGEHGLLIADPTDLAAFGAAVRRVLSDRAFADELGRRARERVVDEFLGDRHLTKWGEVLARLVPDA